MNSLLRLSSAVTVLIVMLASTTVRADSLPTRSSEGASTFQRVGAVVVDAAGPYVERDTLQVQVAAKLGRPRQVLLDGSWLYENFKSDELSAKGTLVIRFENRRVTDLLLVSASMKAQVIAAARRRMETDRATTLAASP